jgi:hypothetical protein
MSSAKIGQWLLRRLLLRAIVRRMKTRNRKPAALNLTDATKPNGSFESNAAPGSTDTNQGKTERLSFFLTEDGKPDFARMHPSTKEKMSAFVRDSSVLSELGISPEKAKENLLDIGFSEDEANGILDLLGGIDSVAASKIYGIPLEVTSEAFRFTTEHRKKINPPLIRLLNKWGPAVIKTWKDEIGLGIVIASVLNTQVQLMHILEARRKRTTPRAPVTQMPSPVEKAPAPAPVEAPKPAAREAEETDPLMESLTNA